MGNFIKKFSDTFKQKLNHKEAVRAHHEHIRDARQVRLGAMSESELDAKYSVEDDFRSLDIVTEVHNAYHRQFAAAVDAETKSLMEKDTRYNEPKGKPQASVEEILKTIEENQIYSRAKELILKAQQEQVAYGLDKYPEPLNKDTWSVLETIDHSISEKVDDLHYTMMLRIKIQDEIDSDNRYQSFGGTNIVMSGADLDGDIHTATSIHHRHGSGKCWCE